MAMFRKVVKSSDFRMAKLLPNDSGYYQYRLSMYDRLANRLEFYFNSSKARSLGFAIKEGPGKYYEIPGGIWLVAMTTDPKTFTGYLQHMIATIEVPVPSLETTANFYDVRGINFNELNDVWFWTVKRMKPVLTKDWDLKHPIKSMNEVFQEFQRYVFTDTSSPIITK